MNRTVLILFLIQITALTLFGQVNDIPFNEPYVDVDEWRDQPIRHRYVHGGFTGTETRFSFYFPPKEAYKGHFFQYITPVPDNEFLSQGMKGEEDKISFAVSNGAYFIETNGGGMVNSGNLIGAYQANAASAQYSRVIANTFYGEKHHYGYAFGGSGGAYRTVGGIENTDGVWDGVVPYVIGSPIAIPNVFSVRMNAMRILNDKFPQIIDALEPGGSGDMYTGLNNEEREALKEVTKMGFPPKSWFGYETMGVHGFAAVYPGMVMADKSYFETDFWQTKGYLGENPSASIHASRIQFVSKIKAFVSEKEAVEQNLISPYSENERGTAEAAWKSVGMTEAAMPIAFQLENTPPDVNFMGGDLIIKSGAAAGNVLRANTIGGDKVVFHFADPKVLALIKVGDEVQVDNSNFLAAQTYHRHQDPGSEYSVWEQFRDENNRPLYPQRPVLLGPLFTKSAAGVVPTGKFNGKMIIVASLWDREAFPWQADWYYSKVKEHVGDDVDNYFRLWYVDRALHGDLTMQEDPTRTVSYLGVLQQALLDVSNWVENGVEPPASTNYTIEDGQVILPSIAADRKGIQAVVDVKVNGGERADIDHGQSATFTATIEIPPHTGRIVGAEWDFEGNKDFPVTEDLTHAVINDSGTQLILKSNYTFLKPGTYFPTLRVISQRDGNTETPFTRIQNLNRVRVVVE